MNKHVKIPAAVQAMLDAMGHEPAAAENPDPSSKAEPTGAGKTPQPPEAETPEPTAEDKLAECACEPETDIGNGRRLLIRYGNRILHVARVGWHGFDGKHWKEDEDGSVVRPLAQKTAEFIDDEAMAMSATEEEAILIEAGQTARKERIKMGRPAKDWSADKSQRWLELEETEEAGEAALKTVKGRRSARHRFAKSSAGTSKINNLLTEAAPHVARMVNDMNTDLFAFNCSNGTLRFVRVEDEDSDPDDPRYRWEARLDAHRAGDYISKLGQVEYRPDAKAPEFQKFFQTVQPDPAVRLFLQRFFGYSLLGLTKEQCLLFFYGAGRNGKSTFIDLMTEMMGNYAVTLSVDSFAGEGRRSGAEATPDLARLPGARLVAASEPESGVHLKESLIKTLTGGERIPVRRLQQEFIEVIPQFKIVMVGNHKPVIRDTSDGIWRRVLLVPWEIQIPSDQVDRRLPEKLRAEADGVFAWLVRGALDYLTLGLAVPDKVTSATSEYREDSDPIGAFIRAGCIVTGQEHDSSTPDDICVGYANWAAREGQPEFRKSTLMRRFPDYARKQWEGTDGMMHAFRKHKSSTTRYVGIKVRDEYMRVRGDGHGSDPDGGGGYGDQ
ncbi:phage/plasmid primase, P4 family [uncultured Hoeflea sp.]|uniref:phage/plasmid primase, P4 family n=1 Tax=uncultured Hoeflea sp. TaxID=538666 RepID=UPI0030DC2477